MIENIRGTVAIVVFSHLQNPQLAKDARSTNERTGRKHERRENDIKLATTEPKEHGIHERKKN